MKKVLLVVLSLLIAGFAYADDTKFSHVGIATIPCVTPGTAVQFVTASTPASRVYVRSNSQISHDVTSVYIGNSSVSAGGAWGTAKAKAGICVMSPDVLEIPVDDLSKLYMDSAHTADSVSVMWLW